MSEEKGFYDAIRNRYVSPEEELLIGEREKLKKQHTSIMIASIVGILALAAILVAFKKK